MKLGRRNDSHMRTQTKYAISGRSQGRSFFTETQIVKFIRPRSQDDLTGLIRATPNSSIYTTEDEGAITALSQPLPLAQKVSA